MPYRAQVLPLPHLGEGLREILAGLYLEHYDGSDRERFFADLAAKEEAIVVYHRDEVVGFTTYTRFRREWRRQADPLRRRQPRRLPPRPPPVAGGRHRALRAGKRLRLLGDQPRHPPRRDDPVRHPHRSAGRGLPGGGGAAPLRRAVGGAAGDRCRHRRGRLAAAHPLPAAAATRSGAGFGLEPHLDHDTPDVFDATVQFAVDAAIDLPRFALLTPFPGTPLHRRLETEGRILSRDWGLYDGQHVVFQPRGMTVEQLAAGHERAWKQVYAWPAIARRLWRARNFQPLALSANLGYRFYAHRLHRFYTCDWPTVALPPLLPRQPAPSAPADNGNRAVCG